MRLRDPQRPKLEALQKLAEVESKRREQMYRLNRPVWTKVNRLELLIAVGVIALIAAWVLYLALT